MNFYKLWFPWKPEDVQLGTIPENARIGDCYQCAKFHACIKKRTISVKFRVMPLEYESELCFTISNGIPEASLSPFNGKGDGLDVFYVFIFYQKFGFRAIAPLNAVHDRELKRLTRR